LLPRHLLQRTAVRGGLKTIVLSITKDHKKQNNTTIRRLSFECCC